MYPSGQIVFWVDQKYKRANGWSDVCSTPTLDRVSSTVKSKSRVSSEYPVRYPAAPLRVWTIGSVRLKWYGLSSTFCNTPTPGFRNGSPGFASLYPIAPGCTNSSPLGQLCPMGPSSVRNSSTGPVIESFLSGSYCGDHSPKNMCPFSETHPITPDQSNRVDR